MSEADPNPRYNPPAGRFDDERSDLRAEFTRAVGNKLNRTGGLWQLTTAPQDKGQLYVANSFLTDDVCRALCDRIDANSVPSPLFEKEKYEGMRTSYTCYFDGADPVVASVNERISDLLGLDPALGEPLQGQRYHVGQQFKEHCDFFFTDQPYWPEYESHGGQRTWTAMIFLNRPERGGVTAFRRLNLALEPHPGRLITWNNVDDSGRPNPVMVHEGQPVEAGVKYIVTKWYRERPFV
ncbi:2OG-Fe(II) oxygenase [Sphingomonas sabuli]|uniref:2OG-Fe(II) oxygenase n=1 Tax=Sphingomonas sabuli TaxID=2764186 RepID=A0A7G9L2T5_9SPHN|nr:2OG-Fe(II) oxygenase [Sphingomonas sabuli]QNM82934.1 2OG-Fe(II) oxygenase [Sphingomonas sabuli]